MEIGDTEIQHVMCGRHLTVLRSEQKGSSMEVFLPRSINSSQSQANARFETNIFSHNVIA